MDLRKAGACRGKGLIGQTGNEGLLVSKADDIEKIDFSRRLPCFPNHHGNKRVQKDQGADLRQDEGNGVTDPEKDLIVSILYAASLMQGTKPQGVCSRI